MLAAKRIAVALVLASFLLWPYVGASAQTSISISLDSVDASAFPAMSARATVTDENGLPVRGLAASAFELVEDGRVSFPPESAQEVSDDGAPVSVLLLVDLASTMRGAPLQAAKNACTSFTEALLNQPNDSDRVAFIGFGAQVDVTSTAVTDQSREVAFTNDAGQLLNVMNFVEPEATGGTPLYDAIYRAVRITAHEAGRRAIIVMTDGRDVGSTLKDDDPIAEAQQQRIPIFTIGLSNSRLDGAYLTRVAELTGGSYQEAPGPDELSQKVAQVLSDLKVQYLLTFTSTLPQQDGQYHSLLLRVIAGPAQAFDEIKYQLGEAPAPEATNEVAAVEDTAAADATPAATDATTAATEPAVSSATAASLLATPESPQSEVGMEALTDALRDKPLLIVVIAAALFLFLVLIILVIWFVRRRSGQPVEQPQYPSQQYFAPPEPPAFPRPVSTAKSEFETSDGSRTAAAFDSFGQRSQGFGPTGDRASGTETEAAPPGFGAPWPASPPFAQSRQGSETLAGPAAAPVSPFGEVPPPSPFAATPPPASFGQAPPQSSTPFGAAVPPPPALTAAPTPAPVAPMDDGEATVVMQRSAGPMLLGLLINRRTPSERYDVDRPTVSIGRSKGNTVVLDNPTVSRQHATLKLEGDKYVLYDLGSANGTFVGDQRLREPVALEDGMVVRFGEVEFTFKLMSLQ